MPELKKQTEEETMIDVDNPDFDEAVSIEDVNPTRAIELFNKIIQTVDSTGSLASIKEQSIFHLGKLYARQGRKDDLKQLFISIQPFFTTIHKSRTAKIVRLLIDSVGDGSDVYSLQAEMCRDAIAWATNEKRTFLKQRIESRLASLYLKMKQYNDAINIITKLIREVKKFDDKLLLVEIYLVESRAYLALQNLPKSKGALTAARSNANSIYCPPLLQAEIDLQAGILSAAEGDYKTSYSYFYEAFEGYGTMKESGVNAVRALKYMLLSKIMMNQYDEVYAIINGKAGVKFAGIEIEAMRAVTDAYKARSIHRFEEVFNTYNVQLAQDAIISSHLNELKEKLLEQNLLRLIEPFSRVQITHVATLIKLPAKYVENKLSEMILDSKLAGILDQGAGDLIVFEKVESNKTYADAVATVTELNGVVDKLYTKAKQLTK